MTLGSPSGLLPATIGSPSGLLLATDSKPRMRRHATGSGG